MRTNIEINNALMRQAMKAAGVKTKRATVEAGLRLLLRLRAQSRLRRLRGKIAWEGDLRTSRLAKGEK